MARHRNASFVGTGVGDVDVDSPTFKRTVKDVAGDVALTHDILTGENGISSALTVDHSGGARGCPLGLPLVNQFFGMDLTLFTPSTKDTNGGTGDTIIAPYVLFLPTGEDTLLFAAYGTFHERLEDMAQPHLQILDTTMTVLHDVPLSMIEDDGVQALHARITGLTPGLLLAFFCVRTDLLPTASDIAVGYLRCVTIHHGRKREQRIAPERRGSATGVWTPSATQGVAHRDFDASFFGETQPISGYEMVGINRNINGLEEFVTGAPAGINAAYTHVDHDGAGAADAINPARSRFDAHTRSLYASEPEVEFPVWAASFGSHLRSGKFTVDLVEPPTIGMLDGHAPWPIATSAQEIAKTYCYLPDFQTTSSRLKMTTLVGSDGDADVGSWTIKCKTGVGTSTGAAPAAMDLTNDWWLATETAIDFTPDAAQQTGVITERTGAKTGIGELAILAAVLYFDPP